MWGSGFELRFEPASSDRVPWVLDLDAKSARWFIVGAVLVGAFVVFGLLVTPELLADLWNRSEYESLIAQRSTQGQRLQSLVDELENLSERVRETEAQLQRIYLAYGFGLEGIERKEVRPAVAEHSPSSIYSPLVQYGNEKRVETDEHLRSLGVLLDRVEELEDPVPSFPGLPHGESTYGVAGEIHLRQFLSRLLPQVLMAAPLNNAEERPSSLPHPKAAAGPVRRELERGGGFVPGRGIRETVIENHHDIRTEVLLHPYRLLRAEEAL